MAETMVERLTKAICAANGGHSWYAYVDHARAALAAMREPTPAMIEPVLPMYDHMIPGSEWPFTVNVWRKMIDAALQEKPT